MKKIQLYALIMLLITTQAYAGFFSSVHTSALMLGNNKDDVLTQAEHILGEPIKTECMDDDRTGGFELRYYSFTDENNIILVFNQNRFFQLIVEAKNPEDIPFITDMTDQLKGFLIVKKDKKIEIQLLGRSNAQLSSEMLMIKALDIAWTKFKKNNYADAKMVALNTLKQYPKNANAINLLGNIDLRENKLKSSIKYFEEAIEILESQNERTDYILNNLAMAYFKDSQYEKAQQLFEKSIEVADDLNCAGRIGNCLVLISMDKEDQAKKTISPCMDSSQNEAALENLFNYFKLSDESLKNKALKLLK